MLQYKTWAQWRTLHVHVQGSTTEQCTSICLISASSSRENSSDVSSGVRGVASQSAACTISKLSSTVGAALAAVNGEGGTLKGKQTLLFSKLLTQMGKTIWTEILKRLFL